MNIPASKPFLTAALEGLTALDAVYLERHDAPLLYESGVRYQREPAGNEQWLTVPQVEAVGWGDCEDLAAWRAAELRVHLGEPARAIAIRTGAKKFHAVVRRADGSIEDPSRELGMEPVKRWQK